MRTKAEKAELYAAGAAQIWIQPRGSFSKAASGKTGADRNIAALVSMAARNNGGVEGI